MKKISALLAIVCALLLVTSCNNTDNNTKQDLPSEAYDSAVSDTTDDELPFVYIPDISGNDEDFDIYLAYNSFDSDFIADKETGDLINDIIFRRNNDVEDTFDINLVVRPGNTDNGSATAQIRSLIQGGDDTYEVFVNVQHYGVPLIYEDLFYDWTTYMPYVSLDKPWWYQNVNRDLNFGDKVYVAAGAYNFHCLRATGCLEFNKTLLDEADLEYPYDLVTCGEWTIDKMLEYTKAITKDLNGDGTISPDDDRMGYAGWKWEAVPALFVGMGGQPVTKDTLDFPELNINNERTFAVVDKMIETFQSGYGNWANGREYGFEDNMFRSGRLLFNDSTLGSLPGNAAMEDDFGVLPYPKLNREQENYHSRTVNYSSLTYIPVTNAKLELTSAVLEYMAYLSYKDLIPAFYDVILEVRTTRDTESEEMVDIIRESARFMDENYLTSSNLITMAEGGTNTLSSSYASYGSFWESKLDDIKTFWYN